MGHIESSGTRNLLLVNSRGAIGGAYRVQWNRKSTVSATISV